MYRKDNHNDLIWPRNFRYFLIYYENINQSREQSDIFRNN